MLCATLQAWASKRERAAAAAVSDEKVESMEVTNDDIDDDFITSYRFVAYPA